MRLPDRAAPLIESLRSFASSPSLTRFRADARQRHGEDTSDESALAFEDYLLFSHRDASRRTVVDLFLSDPASESLDAEARAAIARFRDSRFGVFRVDRVVPGAELVLRPLLEDLKLRVIEQSASRELASDALLVARLLPYRDAWELVSCFVWPAEDSYPLERSLRQLPAAEKERLSDPLAFRNFLRDAAPSSHRARRREPSSSRVEPADALEAEILAGERMAEAGLRLSVAEVKARFRESENPLSVLKTLDPPPSCCNEREFRLFLDAWFALWNHTPRHELGELTPNEIAGGDSLASQVSEDLLRTLATRIPDPGQLDETERRSELDRIQREWAGTPQEELGGRSPEEILELGRIPSLPPESSLPPPDVPVQSIAKFHRLLASAISRPRAALWALQRAVARRQFDRLDRRLVEEALAILLESSGRLFTETWRVFSSLPQSLREPWYDTARAAIEREPRENLKGRGPYPAIRRIESMARALRDAPDEYLAPLRSLLAEKNSNALFAVLPLLERGCTRREPEAMKTIRTWATSDDEFRSTTALTLVVRHGHPDDVEGVFSEFLLSNRGARSGERNRRNRGAAIASRLRRLIGSLDWLVGAMLTCEIFAAIDPDVRFSPEERRARLVPPRSDPAASARGDELLPMAAWKALALNLSRGEFRAAGIALFERTRAALDAIDPDDPAAAIAGRMQAVVRALDRCPWSGWKGSVAVWHFSALGKILAWALRGRDVHHEWNRALAGKDRELARSLCRVDLEWIDEERLAFAASHVDPEELEEIARGEGTTVTSNACVVRAVQNPESCLKRGLDYALTYSMRRVVVNVIATRGDACLPAFFEWAREQERGWSERPGCDLESGVFEDRETVFQMLGALGTERAASVAELALRSMCFHGGESAPLCEASIAPIELGTPALLESLLERMEHGAVDLTEESRHEAEFDETVEQIATVFELLDRDAAEALPFVKRAVARWERAEDARIERTEAPPWGPWPGPGSTAERETPRVGRNEPCPCGSGKKFKKCCGA